MTRNFDLDKKGFDESSGRKFDLVKYQKQALPRTYYAYAYSG